MARARSFLGVPLIAADALGLGLAPRRLDPSPLQLVCVAWALSALVAYGLRYLFIDLFQYQKELYWAGALLALEVSASSVGKRAFTAALIFALLAYFAVEFREMAEQFYRSLPVSPIEVLVEDRHHRRRGAWASPLRTRGDAPGPAFRLAKARVGGRSVPSDGPGCG